MGDDSTRQTDLALLFSPPGPLSCFRQAHIWACLLISCLQYTCAAQGTAKIEFQRDVVPILGQRCTSCHSGDHPKGQLDLSDKNKLQNGGESGAVVAPGQPAKSLLMQFVDDNTMPPKKPLTDVEKNILREWIRLGAQWDGPPQIDALAFSGDERAGKDWWSWQPLKRPEPPTVRDQQWSRSAIDRFVQSKLDSHELMPAPEAARRLVARRLWYDLLGLPPQPEEVESFVLDQRPDAYERLVDRLLASPLHGEHWARHWLDVAHFGESDGFEYDRLRPNAWPYRDWVIRAFNQDMPFDEFARQQIAGDLLQHSGERDSSDAISATGFIVGGAHDGLKPQVESMRLLMRQDELEDLSALVGQTFLGLTVQCARCHDHKFDPIRQTDYYRFVASLSGVHRGERSIAVSELVQRSESKLARLLDELKQIEGPARASALRDRTASRNNARPVDIAYQWDFRQPASLFEREIKLHGGASLENEGLVLDGTSGYAATGPLEIELADKTLEVWLTLANLQMRGGAAISVQGPDGGQFDAIVYGERQPRHWMAGSNNFQRTQDVGGIVEDSQGQEIHVAITYSLDGTITIFRNGQAYGKSYAASLAKFTAGKSQILFGLRHGTPGPGRMFSGTIHRARVHARCLSSEEVRESFEQAGNFLRDEEITSQLTDVQIRRRESLKADIIHSRDALREQRDKRVFAVTPQSAPTVNVLLRGNPLARGDVVQPGGLTLLESASDKFELASTADEAERRLGFAKWITSTQNPLFARTIVNRVWQYHFGIGLVRTPNDLGFNGGQPSHLELLDWLSTSLIDSHFSLKNLHRQIVNSAAYRQSAALNPQALSIDADNRLLWRRAPFRLSSEMLRDSMLVVAGAMNCVGGGPGYQDFRPFLRGGTQFYERTDPTTPNSHRRTVYRTWARGGTNPLLDVFDCPDPSTLTPTRSYTNTPLQSLALLNNSFSMRMAEQFAERLQRAVGDDQQQAIRLGYAIVYYRSPDPAELKLGWSFIQQHGLVAWCRVLLNSNEFLYVR